MERLLNLKEEKNKERKTERWKEKKEVKWIEMRSERNTRIEKVIFFVTTKNVWEIENETKQYFFLDFELMLDRNV